MGRPNRVERTEQPTVVVRTEIRGPLFLSPLPIQTFVTATTPGEEGEWSEDVESFCDWGEPTLLT